MKNVDKNDVDFQTYSTGSQPRKAGDRKSRRVSLFPRFDQGVDEFEKHRHNYNRAADKNSTRAQLRAEIY